MSSALEDGDRGGFLSRWSRRKADVRRGEAVADEPLPSAPLPAAGPAAAPLPLTTPPLAEHAAPPGAERPAAPTLDEVATLTPASDFSRFVARDVAPEVKNAALKKLFADPHFNLMDGLDTYIEDFGRPDPLPEGMLQQMAQARFLGLFTEPEAADERDALPHTTPQAPDAPMVTDPDPNDEDPDLRLQPDDAAGPAGPEASPVGHPGREHGRA
ncbi:MAG: DUF3306 domain-containing protein [Burkholderiaceae bacterium]